LRASHFNSQSFYRGSRKPDPEQATPKLNNYEKKKPELKKFAEAR
jgi:hypothetical protein